MALTIWVGFSFAKVGWPVLADCIAVIVCGKGDETCSIGVSSNFATVQHAARHTHVNFTHDCISLALDDKATSSS